MCGIAGYVDFDSHGHDSTTLAAMTRSLRHRGPDADGTLIDGACGLAHTRLSIIDITGSPQPMKLPGSDISLVFNGEIYNYRQLRRELEARGETFITSGDTEVLLRWVERGWETILPRFDGMFAFAAWNRRQQNLLLGRDALGEKPLFYATPSPGLLVFGSESKALLKHPAVDRSFSPDALRQALRFRAVYGAGCLHRGIRQLEPGTYLEFNRGGVRIGRFYDLVQEVCAARERYVDRTEEEIVRYGWDLFSDSVRERLIADVPVGAFLSGGLDSSLIVAAMRKLREPTEEIRTFSVGFADDPYTELPFARRVAESVGSRHTAVTVGPEHFVHGLSELSSCRDAPVSEPADVAVAEMSRIARESVKVVLSGEGADEIFAGYPKYILANAPACLGAGLRIVGPARAARFAGLIGFNPARVNIAARALSQAREVDRFVQWFSYLDRRDLQALLPGLGWNDLEWEETVSGQESTLSRVATTSRLFRMQAVDCLTWLPGNLLERGDRMTMAKGLEMRPPFLDKELVTFGLALPDQQKVRGRIGKWIVRQWASKLLPQEIVRRKKWGFRVPLAQWFRGPLRAMLTDYLTSRRGLCGTYGDGRSVALLLRSHDIGEVDASTSLWTLLSCEVWYQDVYLSASKASP